MVKHFIDLLPEIREYIYSFCKISDLVNLACCSTDYRNDVTSVSFRHLKILWSSLIDSSLLTEKLKHFQFTTSLVFYERTLGVWPGNMAWEDVSENYIKILNQCNPDKLKTLHLFEINDTAVQMTLQLNNNLHDLQLSYSYHLKSPCWKYLPNVHSLRRLSLFSCNVSDNAISNIAKHPHLKELVISHCMGLTESSLQSISDMAQLTKLNFSDNGNTIGFACLGKLVNLTFLDISGTSIRSDDLTNICFFSSSIRLITLLIHSCCYVRDTTLFSITMQASLKKLDLSFNDITDVSLQYISTLMSLTELILSSCKGITDDGIHMLNSLTSLRTLNIDHCILLTDVSLMYLKTLSLKMLCLSGCFKLSNNGMSYVKSMSSLKYLEIMKCLNISGDGLNHITTLRLKRLKISRAYFSNVAIDRFCKKACMKRDEFCEEDSPHCTFINLF